MEHGATIPGDLRAFKAGYFGYFASLSAVHPFLSLLLTERGLSARLIGVLLLLKTLVGGVLGGLLCGYADQHQSHRIVLLFSSVASTIAMQCLWWTSGGFLYVGFLLLLFGFFSAPVSSIVDSICAHRIEDTKCAETYPQIRLWGAVGWGVFAAVASFLVERSSTWSPAFVIHAVFSVVAVAAFNRLACGVAFHREHGEDERTFMEKIGRLRQTRGTMTFLQLCFWFGTTTGGIEGFLFPVLSTIPGSSERLYGISLSVTCLSESLVFWKASEIIRWVEGGIGVINVCFSAFATRLIAYTMMKLFNVNPWLVLLVEPLHGLTFALTWAWLVNTAKSYGAGGLESFSVAIATASMFNVGYSVGGFIAGMAFSQSPGLAFVPSLSLLAIGWFQYHRKATRTRLKAKFSGVLDDMGYEGDGDVQMVTR